MTEQIPGMVEREDCRRFQSEGKFGELEHYAIEWLARTPWAADPHVFLMNCYVRRDDRPLAEALMAHFRQACPNQPREREQLEQTFAMAFGPTITKASAPVYTDDPKPARSGGLMTRLAKLIPARRKVQPAKAA